MGVKNGVYPGFFWVDEKSLGMCGIGKIIKFHRNSYFSLSGNKYEVRFQC